MIVTTEHGEFFMKPTTHVGIGLLGKQITFLEYYVATTNTRDDSLYYRLSPYTTPWK